MTRTNDQKRAAFALEFIREEKIRGEKERAEMLTRIHKAPMQVLQNGLGQALVFLLADDGGKVNSSGRLYGRLQDWLCGPHQNDIRPCRIYSEGVPDLIKQLVKGERQQYMRAEREAVVLLTWMKKFGEAWLA